eukprot:TRINITY_DN893_c0_g1_i2.p1 TRINITY_DN893_c0_g1~~TRINITY_DN893_c0_g1_i2.p1  ORF type:complete len:210 (+),score=34.60 TRINITY_DN893_c0_g1_i2:495-1124(+)
MIASKNGFEEVVRVLLKGSSPGYRETRDWEGNSPLHFAAENGHFEVVKMLLDGCSDRYIMSQDLSGFTPLHAILAAEAPNYKVVRFLLKKSAPDLRTMKDLDGDCAFGAFLFQCHSTRNTSNHSTQQLPKEVIETFAVLIEGMGWISALECSHTVAKEKIVPLLVEMYKEYSTILLKSLERNQDLLWSLDSLILHDIMPWMDQMPTEHF